jgi:hypothetical protein
MNVPCQLVLKECLPCNDDPIANISAEAPDIDVFIAFRDFRGNPPLGVTYAQLGCKTICFSQTSQQEADDCAQRQAEECVWKTWKPPITPPLPPGPNNTGGKGTPPNTPGGVPPNNPRFPIRRFLNAAQTCDQPCPDGTPFTGTVAAGTIIALSQALADEEAHSLACKRALHDRICFSSALLPGSCIGDAYLFQLEANGGTWFDSHDYNWVISSGSLPPGIEIDPFFGLISGLPLTSGNFTFTVQITDAVGRSQSKEFTICIMEIISPALLPAATQGDLYAQPLIQEPATVSSEVWTLVSGSLPPGITLAANGALNGTPTDLGVSEFTVKVDTDCGSCTKTFTLEVESAVDCMGAVKSVQELLGWVDTSNPGCSMTLVSGDGTFAGTPSPTLQVRANANPLCNPDLDDYTLVVTFDWTGVGFTTGLPGTTRAIIAIDANPNAGISASFPANGHSIIVVTAPLTSGPHNIVIRCSTTAGGAGSASGTVTVRPLTPP